MRLSDDMQAHLASGVTTLCRAWAVTRVDGTQLGFTDHDGDLTFDGIVFRADTGLTALALQQGTGLSVDNTEAMGALSDGAITEADINAGRYDGAEVRCWLVNWADAAQRALQFRGSIGELRRTGGAFEAELLGLTDQLNRPMGRVYQRPCAAVLGDGVCRKDLTEAGYQAEVVVTGIEANVLWFETVPGFDDSWFQRGVLEVLTGEAAGLKGMIKQDVQGASGREITLWSVLGAQVAVGDSVRLTAGCDKRMETCRFKFNNLANFQGFPDIPGNDWTVAIPASATATGGSRR
ncbi:DUF2163 domain-containing protein [Thalassovita sp.]|uniref:DUF2163 domain-containing protein n=1 Tax=Thalassovita sp. TaxID=1979401 RepID=UPI002880F489|nr:DUF2163 domain-containing protein [Thalassovita sp.]MDF1801577.1 DUF2163 domain-containing protein [Thalassovita sp.]